MRASQEEKDRSHARIVESAARLMRERGIDGTGVADVMNEAGLTHGGFYRHFPNKESLLGSALEAAFEQTFARLKHGLETSPSSDGTTSLQNFYLSKTHVDNVGMGCPVAALTCDIARGPAALKAAFSRGVNRMLAALGTGIRGSAEKRRTMAARKLAMMAGAVMIARASDSDTARFILEACREVSR